MPMNIRTRLLRKPAVTLLWILLIAVMTGFLTIGAALYFSSDRLSKALDANNTAVAVRTNPSAYSIKADNDDQNAFDENTRGFTADDVKFFESLDSVKAVRNNTLSGATCPDFYPTVGLNKFTGWGISDNIEPYCNTTVVGTVCRRGEFNGEYVVGINLEAIPFMNSELESVAEILRYIKSMCLVIPDYENSEFEEDYFVPGERYVFSGYFLPYLLTPHYNYYANTNWAVYWIYAGTVHQEGDLLIGSIFDEYKDRLNKPESGICDYDFPVAQRIDGNIDEFFSKDGIWKLYTEKWNKQVHSLPVIGTERIEATYGFVNGNLVVSDGRTFTQEEYDNGEKVMLISETIAELGSLKVGDKIKLSQYVCTGNKELQTNLSIASSKISFNNPGVDLFNLNTEYAPEEEFTVVGIYRMGELWSYGAYSITPNTVFIPQKAQIDGAFGKIGEVDDLYGIYLNIELKNGYIDDFRLAMSQSEYDGQFYTFDQGYEAIQKSMNSLVVSSTRLIIIAAIGWALFLLLFLVVYQASQQRNIGIMRSLGNSPRRTTAYMFGSGLTVTVIGIVIATIISYWIMHILQGNILNDALAGIDTSAFSGMLAISEADLTEMVNSSVPSMGALIVFAAAQLVLIALPMFIQAITLSRKNPRTMIKN